jgi:NAD(P)-dependent dehydrogenase (short-subunit alcohol dehydrogenase family)
VEALVAHDASVTVVARDADALESVRARLGVATISADVTDETAARRILAEVRPDLRAPGALSRMVAPYAAINQIAAWACGTAIFIPVTNTIER